MKNKFNIKNALLFVFVGLLLCSFSSNTKVEIKGWLLMGSKPESYEIGIEDDVTRGGKVGFLKSTQKEINGFGTIMQSFLPKDYIGKRLKLSGYIKSKDLISWAGMWMRIDGETIKNKPTNSLGFDNMQDRAIKKKTEWTKYEIVLDVPEASKNISFGVLVNGTGNVWIDDLKFEIVDKTVPTTKKQNGLYLEKPTNTSFEDEN